MEIYNKIRTLRIKKGYTQEYMASQLHIDAVNYGRIERGQSRLTVERLQIIANVLEIPISELFLLEEDEVKLNLINISRKVTQIEEQLDRIYDEIHVLTRYFTHENTSN